MESMSVAYLVNPLGLACVMLCSLYQLITGCSFTK